MAYAGNRNGRALTAAAVLAAHVAVLFGLIALNRLPETLVAAGNLVLVRLPQPQRATLPPPPPVVPQPITLPAPQVVLPPIQETAPVTPRQGAATGFSQTMPLDLGLAPTGTVPSAVRPNKAPAQPQTEAQKAKAELDEANRQNTISSAPPPPDVSAHCKALTKIEAGGGDPFGTSVCEDVPSLAALKEQNDSQQRWIVNPVQGSKPMGTTVQGDPSQ